MNYEIASLEDIRFDIEVYIEKNGNEYAVVLAKKYERDTFSNHFSSLEEAYTVFEKLSKAIVFGLYSWEEKIKILKGDL